MPNTHDTLLYTPLWFQSLMLLLCSPAYVIFSKHNIENFSIFAGLFFCPGTRCGPRRLSLNEFPSCKWMGGPVKTSLTVVLVARKYFNTYWGFAESLLVKTVQIQWINVFMSLGFGPDCLHPSYSKLKSVQMFHQWLWCYFPLKTSFCWHNFSFFQHFHCLGCWAYIC